MFLSLHGFLRKKDMFWKAVEHFLQNLTNYQAPTMLDKVSFKLSDFLGLAGHLHDVLMTTKISLLSFESLPPSILKFDLPSHTKGRIRTLDSVYQVQRATILAINNYLSKCSQTWISP